MNLLMMVLDIFIQLMIIIIMMKRLDMFQLRLILIMFFYDISIRMNADNSSEIEDQFRKLVIPSLKLKGKNMFDLRSEPDKITEISAEPLDSLLMK
ncbi:hypothetical protein [Algoriphagus boritolerans]|uniref:hypothetical protein n=1 Tax=Algoriphagus boritolerans TaxID=308111 RepID=UPI002FCE6145